MFQDVQPAKRPRGESLKSDRLPELLVIVLDARLCSSELPGSAGYALFPAIWHSIQVFLRAYMLLCQGQKAVILATSANGTQRISEICDASEWEAGREMARKAAMKLAPHAGPMAATLSSSLCLIQRQAQTLKMESRVLLIEASSNEVDHIAESAGLVSAAFAAKSQGTLVDVLSTTITQTMESLR
eukprot:symbB.v1.2.011909.t1/scaffold794.1/size161992/2